jgi:hypothetical protein
VPKNHLKEGKHKTKILRVGLLLTQKEKCIHVSIRSSPRSYSVSLWLFYSLPLSQFSYSRLFADGKVSNPTRRRRKMYANHSATIWLTGLCCFFLGKGRKRLPSKEKARSRFSTDRFVYGPSDCLSFSLGTQTGKSQILAIRFLAICALLQLLFQKNQICFSPISKTLKKISG